ncbi:energy-coupling factor transporter transmembrane component T family protein [Microbacterium rhizomatis]|uniref:Energy-coupling factor transporter transmembrane protein EcfT n=1 Tax=Microbacterium rhizomatis TaxID=1631477 RepID=A0A5J5IWE3_9MICO|nr:energy-coupling factor transporter transmembrane protein EcfT [Microbacterium rhizomatis]KAA9105089.1 energy-coupling factor transporter transmembrane protein EcfT [Microbacterium rhizomatis]
MISLYRPGDSVLHRLPAGVKILAFAVIAVAVSVLAASPIGLGVAAVLTICVYALGGFGPRELVRQALAIKWVVVVMLLTQLVFLPPVTALTNTGRVVVVVVLASLITLTTRVPAVLDSVERGLAPLRRLGADPAAVGLVLALTITAIPVIAGFATAIREAQRARGVRVGPHTAVVPLLVMSIKHSDELAEALAARGVQ